MSDSLSRAGCDRIISELYFSTKYRPLRPHAPFGRPLPKVTLVQASGFGVKTAFLGTTGRAMCRVSHRRKHESARFLFLMMVMHLLFSPPDYPLKRLFHPGEKLFFPPRRPFCFSARSLRTRPKTSLFDSWGPFARLYRSASVVCLVTLRMSSARSTGRGSRT